MPKTFVAAASAMLMSSPADATCQLSNSLIRQIARISPRARLTSSWSIGVTPLPPGTDAHACTRS
ncbi:Uncharacterised protein [Mycobacterium tuberculosis]|uniref:Uncharacterized protein n=1 Tax=Mycobacterium tuberculosis TaxID=1773 RepID=A0A0U0RZW8_MYCTX|nr:Uncharacterised protein [Mycobacterium tuberculosis]